MAIAAATAVPAQTGLRNDRCANAITRHDGKGEWQTSVQSLLSFELRGGTERRCKHDFGGGPAVRLAELLMNSAVPSEGLMRTSWPSLRNSQYSREEEIALEICAGVACVLTLKRGN